MTTLAAILGVFAPIWLFVIYHFVCWWCEPKDVICHWCGVPRRKSEVYQIQMTTAWKHPQPCCWLLNYMPHKDR